MSFVSLKMYDGDGTTLLGELPSFSNLKPMLTLNDVGAFTMDYPLSGIRSNLLDATFPREVALLIDNTERARYLVEEDGRDELGADLQRAMLSISGREVSQLLDTAKVYPAGGAGALPATHTFTNATPGNIMITLLNKAQARGAIPGWGFSFNATNDSSGAPWGTQVTFEYKASASILDVIKHLSNTLGLIDWRVSGRTIHAYKINTTMRQDKTAVVFSPGRDMQKHDRNRSRRELATVLLVEGDEGKTVERVNSTAVATYGRREGHFSQSGVTDNGTLNVIGDLQLGFRSAIKESRPITINFDSTDATPKPFSSFNIGDDVYLKLSDTTTIKQRVMRMSLDMNSSQILKGDIDLNDIFEDAEILADRMIKASMGGIGTGAGTVTKPPNEVVEDQTIPGQPSQPVVSSSVYVENGNHHAQLSVTWLPVTKNTDNSDLEDFSYYQVQWIYGTPAQGVIWREAGITTNTTFYISPVLPGAEISVQVRAVDYNGNAGPFSPIRTITSGVDTTPPEAPAAPIVDNYMGLLRVYNTGGTASGAAPAADEAWREIHISDTNNFTPSPATLVGKVTLPGPMFFEYPPGVTRYAKLVAVDTSGNKSTPSAQGMAATFWVVEEDIFMGAVGTAKLADLAVTTAKINDLAVNNAKIGNVEAGKITAGAINAQLTVSGRIATALSGVRTELNAVGLQGWNSLGVMTVNLNGVDNLLIGRFRTGVLGNRHIEFGTLGDLGVINFYSPDGPSGFIRAFTDNTVSRLDAIQFGVAVPGVSDFGWNIISYSQQELASYRTKAHDFLYQTRFAVVEGSNRSFGTQKTRMQIDASGTIMRSGDINNNGSYWVYSFVTGQMDLAWSTGGLVRIVGGITGISPLMAFATPAGDGLALRSTSGTDGVFMEVVNYFGSAYGAWRAAAFQVVSDERTKKEITDAPIENAMAQLEKIKPKKFKRKGAKDRPVFDKDKNVVAAIEEDGPEEVGVSAQELPPFIVSGNADGVMTVDIIRWMLLLTAAIQENDKKGKGPK